MASPPWAFYAEEMATQDVVIVTDSGAALPVGVLSAYRIAVVPLRVTIGGQPYIEGVNISPPRVVAALVAGETVTVAAPSEDDFAAVYRRLAYEGAGTIVSIHLSARMHDVVPAAEQAAKTASVPVRVIDSGTVAMAEGFVALAAATVARVGGSAARVEEEAARTNAGARLLFTVATMDYLHRDGQVPRVLKALSNATNVRPILSVVDGQVKMVSRIRGTEAARHKVRDDMLAYYGTLTRPAVAVSLVGASAHEEGIDLNVPGTLDDCSAGASLAAHAGPGTYAVAVAPMPEGYVS